ncbi:MAG: hypothetical protein DRH37_00750 [Deltaproteobacteria bacterium]|nr:MAG: hypothetical protein DRH37_00750 [Deltaproteobacteria bacterium]
MALRYYQEEAIKANTGMVDGGQSPLTIMATGTGKTVVIAKAIAWLKKQDMRTLVIAHRGLLLDQIHKSVMDWAGLSPAREQGNEYARWNSDVILATPQTLKGARLERKPHGAIDAVIIDECHRAVTPSMMDIYEHFDQPLKLGFTATADRPDGINLSEVFDKIAYQYSLARGVRDGYLSKIVGRKVTNMQIDLSALRIKMGDYADGDLGDVMEQNMHPIAHNVIKECDGRKKVLLFLPTVDSSEHLARFLNEMGESADFVSGRRKDNGDVFAKFRSGEIKYLCSCQLVVEGYNEPGIDTIVMLRPTLSRIVYSQAIGRGTRIAPGKDFCLLIEFTYNSNKHKLVSAYELMGDAVSERVVESAEAQAGEGDVDFLAALEAAASSQYDISTILARSIPEDFTFKSFNPLDIGDLVKVDLDSEADVWFQGRQLKGGVTPKQQELLGRYMIETSGMDKAHASKLIGGLMDKKLFPLKGYASPNTMRYLQSLYPGRSFPPDMTSAAASMLINSIKEEQSA